MSVSTGDLPICLEWSYHATWKKFSIKWAAWLISSAWKGYEDVGIQECLKNQPLPNALWHAKTRPFGTSQVVSLSNNTPNILSSLQTIATHSHWFSGANSGLWFMFRGTICTKFIRDQKAICILYMKDPQQSMTTWNWNHFFFTRRGLQRRAQVLHHMEFLLPEAFRVEVPRHVLREGCEGVVLGQRALASSVCNQLPGIDIVVVQEIKKPPEIRGNNW